MILKLMQLDSDKAIALFLEKDKIPSEIVVEQLEAYPEYLYMVSENIWFFFVQIIHAFLINSF